jgi:integrase/recombinase XerD
MKLSVAVSQYIAHRQALGMSFVSDGRVLRSFCRTLGDQDLRGIDPERVATFLAGEGPVTSFWYRKHSALNGFFQFAMARGYADHSPLPVRIPKLQRDFLPYIYSRAELKCLLDAMPKCFENYRCTIDADVYRTLILLLYGAALRIGEATALTLSDVDIKAKLLTVADSKLKTRLVPIGTDLSVVLSKHIDNRLNQGARSNSPLFVRRDGSGLTRASAENAFCRLRAQAGIVRYDGARYQPRLHDLRHTAATHRLISWYQAGADVQRLLPQLATYLGHIHISGTQRYLSLTPDMLREASRRFEHYAQGCHYA